MCKFTYTFLECTHRKQDHVDTTSCRYFARAGVHCQPDNPQQCKERGTKVVTRNKNGICDDCVRKAQEEIELELLMRDQRKAAQANRADAEIHKKEQAAWEERQRETRLQETARKIQEKLDREMAEKLQKQTDEELEREEKARRGMAGQDAEQERQRRVDEESRNRRLVAAERRRRGLEEAEKQEREQQAERDREDARRQKEIDNLQDQLAEQEEAKRKRKLDEKAEADAALKREAEARHQDNLKRIREEAERKQRQQDEKDETERLHKEKAEEARKALEASNEQKRRDEEAEFERHREEDAKRKRAELDETERQQKARFERNEALRKEIQAEEDRKKQEDDAAHAEKLARKRAEDERLRREEEELQRILAQRKAAAETHEPTSPPISSTSPALKPSVDYSRLVGNVGAPEIGPYTIGGRRAPIHSSQKLPERTKSPPSPPPTFKPAPAPVARLGGPVHSGPSCMDWKPPQAGTPSTPSTPSWQTNPRPRSTSNRIPTPSEPAIDPALVAKLEKRRAWEAEKEAHEASKSPSPAPSPNPVALPQTKPCSPPPTKPKPPVKPKRISSATSPQRPSPAAEMPARIRVDSAAATPVLESKTGGDDGAWDEPDSRTMRAQRLSQDKFGKQRRAGWKGEE